MKIKKILLTTISSLAFTGVSNGARAANGKASCEIHGIVRKQSKNAQKQEWRLDTTVEVVIGDMLATGAPDTSVIFSISEKIGAKLIYGSMQKNSSAIRLDLVDLKMVSEGKDGNLASTITVPTANDAQAYAYLAVSESLASA